MTLITWRCIWPKCIQCTTSLVIVIFYDRNKETTNTVTDNPWIFATLMRFDTVPRDYYTKRLCVTNFRNNGKTWIDDPIYNRITCSAESFLGIMWHSCNPLFLEFQIDKIYMLMKVQVICVKMMFIANINAINFCTTKQSQCAYAHYTVCRTKVLHSCWLSTLFKRVKSCP